MLCQHLYVVEAGHNAGHEVDAVESANDAGHAVEAGRDAGDAADAVEAANDAGHAVEAGRDAVWRCNRRSRGCQ